MLGHKILWNAVFNKPVRRHFHSRRETPVGLGREVFDSRAAAVDFFSERRLQGAVPRTFKAERG